MGKYVASDLAPREILRPTRHASSWQAFAVRARRALAPLLERLAWSVLWGPRAERIPVVYPPGHYYSPIPARGDLERTGPLEITGIDLRRDEQLVLLAKLDVVTPTGRRYDVGANGWFPPTDAAVYDAMIRLYQPTRVVEVGCGYSTAALFDAGAAPHVTLIDPSLDRVQRLLAPEDLRRCDVFEARLQDVPLSVFLDLEDGDVLFVDSTHVTKFGSDVNRMFFEILPALAPGVIVHIHDIFYPFEYPVAWVRQGRGWNETYLLRAFLEYNEAFEILLWNHMLAVHGDLTGDCGSIWLQKVR